MVEERIALAVLGGMEVEFTGDQENRTSPKSKMRIRQGGDEGIGG